MQVIPLARNPREKKEKKNNVTVMHFLLNPPLCNDPRNHAVVVCSDIFFTCSWFMLLPHVYGSCCFHMFIIHVERSGAVLPFFSEVSTQSPLPNSCLEYGGFQCSHISIIHCVFYCFIVFIHGLFHFLVPFNLLFLFIYFHFVSFFLISCHFFSFFSFLLFLFMFFFFPYFFPLKKPFPI